MGAATVSVDEFQALEQKVLQTVELIKMERAARSAIQADLTAAHAEIAALMAESAAAKAEVATLHAEAAALREQLARASQAEQGHTALLEQLGLLQQETDSLQREREAVRLRVESMLSTLDELL